MDSPAKVRVLVAESHDYLRQTLCKVLANHPQIEVVGAAATEDEVLAQASLHQPDVVLIEGAGPSFNSFHTSLSVKAAVPRVKVVLVADEDSEDYRTAALESGASAYVARNRLEKDLPGVIKSILK